MSGSDEVSLSFCGPVTSRLSMVCRQAHEVQEHHLRDGFETVRRVDEPDVLPACQAVKQASCSSCLLRRTRQMVALQANADGIFESTSVRQSVPIH